MGLRRSWLCVVGCVFLGDVPCSIQGGWPAGGRRPGATAGVRIDGRYRRYASPLVANTEMVAIRYSRYSIPAMHYPLLWCFWWGCAPVAVPSPTPEARSQKVVRLSGCFARRQHKGTHTKQNGLPLTPTTSSVERASLFLTLFSYFQSTPFCSPLPQRCCSTLGKSKVPPQRRLPRP